MLRFELRVLLLKVMGVFAGALDFFPISFPSMIQNLLEGSLGFAWVMYFSQVLRRDEFSSDWSWSLIVLISGLDGSWEFRMSSLVEMRSMASWDRLGI